MVESTEDRNYLLGSNLPSIGCFVTILQYLGCRIDIKHFLAMTFKNGKAFYKKHVKHSTSFSEIAFYNTKRSDLLTFDIGM